MTTAMQIRQRIEGIPAGKPFTTAMFLELGTRVSVDQTLFRLEKSGAIERIVRGVYAKPKANRFVGRVRPTSFEIAQSIASKTGAIVQVSGAEAARHLGLSTQVSTQPVYLTTGQSRTFRIEKMTVQMKHVAPRKLRLVGRPAGLAFTALWYVGKTGISPRVIETLRRKLPPGEFEALRLEIGKMPGWMARAFTSPSRSFDG